MKAKIEFSYLYDRDFNLKSKNEIFLFFKNMKEKVCEDLQNKHVSISSLYRERPTWEKIHVNIVTSKKTEKENGYSYKGIFEVRGIYTKNCYDRIIVELEDVDFLDKVSSIDEYFSIMFKMRYSGILMTEEDVLQYSSISNKSFDNNRLFSLRRIDEVCAKEYETHADKVNRLALELSHLVGKKPFEVHYALGTIEQRVLYLYDEKEHFSFLSYLVDRTRTHDVKIRLVDNEIAEWYKLSKGLYETKIRKVQ